MKYRILLEALVEIPDNYVVENGNIILPNKHGHIEAHSDIIAPVIGFWSSRDDVAIAQESMVKRLWNVELVDYLETTIINNEEE